MDRLVKTPESSSQVARLTRKERDWSNKKTHKFIHTPSMEVAAPLMQRASTASDSVQKSGSKQWPSCASCAERTIQARHPLGCHGQERGEAPHCFLPRAYKHCMMWKEPHMRPHNAHYPTLMKHKQEANFQMEERSQQLPEVSEMTRDYIGQGPPYLVRML